MAAKIHLDLDFHLGVRIGTLIHQNPPRTARSFSSHNGVIAWLSVSVGESWLSVKRLGSSADNLREVIEVLVSCVQGKVVLQDESRQPHIVRRNRCALFPELAEHGSVVVSRLVVGKEHTHAIFQEEASQDPLVLGLPTAVREAGPKLTDDDEGQHDRLGFLQERHGLGGPSAEIDVPIRVESNPHRQRSSSTLS